MVGSFVKLAAAAAFSILVTGCASTPELADMSGGRGAAQQSAHLQCVPYARAISGVSLFGDAWTWWQKAAGKYARSHEPSLGAVMVLYNYAGPKRAHLAVVSSMKSSREIRIDHANWLDQGAVFTNVPVYDMSADNDWSDVKVYNPATHDWGARLYDVQGFIGPGSDSNMVAATD
jgi:surface antigen